MRPASGSKAKTSSKKNPDQPKASGKYDFLFSQKKEEAVVDTSPTVFGKPITYAIFNC